MRIQGIRPSAWALLSVCLRLKVKLYTFFFLLIAERSMLLMLLLLAQKVSERQTCPVEKKGGAIVATS